jgi:hypothetical protein
MVRVWSVVCLLLEMMRKACVLRATGHKSFAVKFSHFPGIVEVHCSDVEINDNARFSRDMRSLICHKIASKQTIEAVKPSIEVDIELGQYCVNVRAFVSSKLRYPSIISDDAYENAFLDDSYNHQFHMDDIDGNVSHAAVAPRGVMDDCTVSTMECVGCNVNPAPIRCDSNMNCSIPLTAISEDIMDNSLSANGVISQLSLDPV